LHLYNYTYYLFVQMHVYGCEYMRFGLQRLKKIANFTAYRRINPLPMNIVLKSRWSSVLGIQFRLPRFKASNTAIDYVEGKIMIRNHAKDIIGGKFSIQGNSVLTENIPCNSHARTECVYS
jgi:hypothetical protein